MQLYTVYFVCRLLYMFRVVSPPVIGSTNNCTSDYQSTNETHYTLQNTTITTHKGSQLLMSKETLYQPQPSNKQLHTEHTPLRTTILH